MNYADKMEMEEGLKTNLAHWMMQHGMVISDRSRSNAYACARIVEVIWRDMNWRINEIDGMGFTVVPFGQGFKDMSPPTKEFYKLLMEGKIIHGGNPIMRWMAGNVGLTVIRQKI